MFNVLNVATPPTAATVVVPLKVPVAGFVPIAKTTFAVEPVTVLPFASWIVTTTLLIVAPLTVLLGWVVNATFAAAPAVMLKVLDVAPVKLADAAVNV